MVLLTIAILLIPVTIVRALDEGRAVELVTLVISAAVLWFVCVYLSSSKRWSR